MELEKLNEKQLKQVISSANSALVRIQKEERVMSDIQRIARKHKLSIDELATLLKSLKTASSRQPAKVKKKRAKVAPVYQSKDGLQKWTGRGRSPSWVVEICQREGLSVSEFKLDKRYTI